MLYTGINKYLIAELGNEARNCAVLDTACTSTCCGKTWMTSYLGSLNQNNENRVERSEIKKVFKFGARQKLRSLRSYKIPVEIAGKMTTITTDVVKSNIPLLLSLSAMK